MQARILHTRNVQCVCWKMNCLFSVDLMAIDVRIYIFLNKTLTNNFPFERFPLVQCLLIVLSIEVTYISNGCQGWVAYSQGRASAGSHAHLVIEFGPSLSGCFRRSEMVTNSCYAALAVTTRILNFKSLSQHFSPWKLKIKTSLSLAKTRMNFSALFSD